MNRTIATLTLVAALGSLAATAPSPRPRGPGPRRRARPSPGPSRSPSRGRTRMRVPVDPAPRPGGRRRHGRHPLVEGRRRDRPHPRHRHARRRATSSTTCPTRSRSGPRPAPSPRAPSRPRPRCELLRSSTLDPYGRTLGYLFLNGRNYSVLVVQARLSAETVTFYGDNGLPDGGGRGRWPRRRRRARCPSSRPTSSARRMRELSKWMKENGARGRAVRAGRRVKTPPRRACSSPWPWRGARSLLWDTFVVYPFRLFVVFLHEISHGLAAVLTGGSIVSIGLSFDEGGVCLTRGGWPFLILNAGYLGQPALGRALPRCSARGARGRASVVGVDRRLHPGGHRSSTCAPGSASSTASPPASCSWPWPPELKPRASPRCSSPRSGRRACLYAVWDVASDVLLRHSRPERRRRARAAHRRARASSGASPGSSSRSSCWSASCGASPERRARAEP